MKSFLPIIKSLFLLLLFTLSFLSGLVGSYLSLSIIKTSEKVKVKKEEVGVYPPSTLPDVSYNILLLGYGGAGHEGSNLSDVVMVVSINPAEKKVGVFSIPRDLWVEIPVRSDLRQGFKINHAYAIGLDDDRYPLKEPQYKGEGGGAAMAKKVVSEVTGLPIHYFVAVDFEGFKRIIDILGGIEVDVPVAFDDYFYPIKGKENDTCGKSAVEIARLHSLYSDTQLHHQFECRYEHIHFDKGRTKMDGETALKFVRSRSSSQHGGDFARSVRQQAVLLGLKDKLISIDALQNIDHLFEEFAAMVRTDLDLSTLKNLVEVLGQPQEYKVSFLSLSEDNVLVSTKSLDGQFILLPRKGEGMYSEIQKYIKDELAK